jgi:hypothetical protein
VSSTLAASGVALSSSPRSSNISSSGTSSSARSPYLLRQQRQAKKASEREVRNTGHDIPRNMLGGAYCAGCVSTRYGIRTHPCRPVARLKGCGRFVLATASLDLPVRHVNRRDTLDIRPVIATSHKHNCEFVMGKRSMRGGGYLQVLHEHLEVCVAMHTHSVYANCFTVIAIQRWRWPHH